MCWWRVTPTTCRCTAKRRSWPGRASRSAARCWPAGSARPPSRSGRWWRGCARSCVPRCGCSPTRPPCRCSTPAGARPRPASPGRSPATTGPGAAPRRRRWCSTTPPAAGRSTPARCSRAARASCNECDGYAGYKGLAAPKAGGGGATLVYCWSHVRREFFDLAAKQTAPIAEEALRRIAALYAIEDTVRGKPPDMRRATRRARSRPLVTDLFAWLEQQLARLPGSSPTAEAIRYALNHRDGLERFLEDGRVEMDSNVVERAIRPLVLSRKNALFASGDDGGRRWADLASLIETCKLNGVNPQAYLTDLLTRLVNGWPQSRIDELMPWHWAPAKAS